MQYISFRLFLWALILGLSCLTGPILAQPDHHSAQELLKKGLRTTKVSEKIKYFKKAIEIDPDFSEAHFRLGINYYHAGDYQQAIKFLQRAMALDAGLIHKIQPYLVRAYIFLAQSLIEQEKYDEASELTSHALQYQPDYAPGLATRGMIYYFQRNWMKAIQMFTQSLNLDKNQAQVWNKLCSAYLKLNDFPQAIQACENALALDPQIQEAEFNLYYARQQDQPEMWIERAENLWAEGKWDQATQLLRRASTLYPKNEKIKNRLQHYSLQKTYLKGLRAFEDENWQEAIEFFEALDTDYKDVAEKLSIARKALEREKNTILPGISSSTEPQNTNKPGDGSQSRFNQRLSLKIASIDSLAFTQSITSEKKFLSVREVASQKQVNLPIIQKRAHAKHLFQLNLLLGSLILGGIVILGLLFILKSKESVNGSLEPWQTQEFISAKIASETPLKMGFDLSPSGNEAQQQKISVTENPTLEIETPVDNNATKTFVGGMRRVERIGRYLLEKEIGRGSMGVVFQAWDPKLDRKVVIKKLALDIKIKPLELQKLKERLLREARTAGRLNHPNIVTIHDVGESARFTYIVMEYLNGQNLKTILNREGKIDLKRAFNIVRQICLALQFAHAHQIIHRDIKPSNIILLEEDQVKVADFGIAKLPNFETITDEGSVVGTPYYMSPEQIEGRPVDGRSDIFSLGVLMYEMLSGIRPFDGNTLPTIIYKIIHESPTPLTIQDQSLSDRVDGILNKMLAKDMDERYATVTELLSELDNFENDL